MDENHCILCGKKLKNFKINFEQTILMCPDLKCLYPFQPNDNLRITSLKSSEIVKTTKDSPKRKRINLIQDDLPLKNGERTNFSNPKTKEDNSVTDPKTGVGDTDEFDIESFLTSQNIYQDDIRLDQILEELNSAIDATASN